ncbi:MAG: quinolinate synthase NadA [Elusimicrobiota bacterium]|jgi:quinolinate synthase|nr:quinolinate synthase NadA [Elusimicrobiota bacterium]
MTCDQSDILLTEQEAQRLFSILGYMTNFRSPKKQKYTLDDCREFAPFTLAINRLKKEKGAIILAHYYSNPEITFGIADFRGDSYALSKQAADARENIIVFCGVSFMAETAKIISPQKKVYLPALKAGCSLADAVSEQDVINLKARYPKAQVICYINSTAAVKAQSDICVTSSNVYDIVAASPAEQIIFIPDIYMADNIKIELDRRGIKKEIIPFGGTCCVHDKYTPKLVEETRQKYPQAKIICHPECPSDVCLLCDFVGSTSAMIKYVRQTPAVEFAILSEDGIVNTMQYENTEKVFYNYSRTCGSMKRNTLANTLAVLQNPAPEAEIIVEAQVAQNAKRAIDNMFKEVEKK